MNQTLLHLYAFLFPFPPAFTLPAQCPAQCPTPGPALCPAPSYDQWSIRNSGIVGPPLVETVCCVESERRIPAPAAVSLCQV